MLGQRFDFATFDANDIVPTRGAMDERGRAVTLQSIANSRATPDMFGSGYYEMLARQITADLQAIRDRLRPGQRARLLSKGISFGVLARNPDGSWNISRIEGLPPESTASPDAQHPPSLLILPFSQAGAFVSRRVFTVNAFNHQGYSYLATNLDMSAEYYHSEINQDLLNSGSVFSQHQCGASGYISWQNLHDQTIRHESGAAASHYSEYVGALNSNNPGTYFESQIANPTINAQTFFQGVRNQLTSTYNSIGSTASQENIPPVNYSPANVLLGNAANGGYTPCH